MIFRLFWLKKPQIPFDIKQINNIECAFLGGHSQIAVTFTPELNNMGNAIISGATKGIGRAIAEKLVREGMNVAFCARNTEEIEQTLLELRAINPNVSLIGERRDMSQKQEAKDFGISVLGQWDTVHLVVNNTGQFVPGEIRHEDDGMLEHMIETNLYSAYHLTRAVLPAMMENDAAEGSRGHIFTICSVAGLQPYKNGGSYSISKYALHGFTQNLRAELKPYAIKVTAVNPGATWSDSWKGMEIDENRIMKATDIADLLWSVYQLSPQTVVEEIVMRPQLGDL